MVYILKITNTQLEISQVFFTAMKTGNQSGDPLPGSGEHMHATHDLHANNLSGDGPPECPTDGDPAKMRAAGCASKKTSNEAKESNTPQKDLDSEPKKPSASITDKVFQLVSNIAGSDAARSKEKPKPPGTLEMLNFSIVTGEASHMKGTLCRIHGAASSNTGRVILPLEAETLPEYALKRCGWYPMKGRDRSSFKRHTDLVIPVEGSVVNGSQDLDIISNMKVRYHIPHFFADAFSMLSILEVLFGPKDSDRNVPKIKTIGFTIISCS